MSSSTCHPIAVFLLLLGGCAGPRLPLALRSVVLYRNGVGYFERTGWLAGERLRLRFRGHELDDAIKTLAVIDEGGGGGVVAVRLPPHAARGAAEQSIDVAVGGRGRGDLVVSYAVPTPAWRATYRVVLPPSAHGGSSSSAALFQAWAIVDNASGEDWNGVRLSLDSGAPLSFATDLRTPQFVPRPDATGRLVQPVAVGAAFAERAQPGDRDGDGIPDAKDRCPAEPESWNGFEDEDGCPDAGRVVVHKGRIEILDKIYFAAGADEIKPVSRPVLDAIAATLRGNPAIRVLAVQGHASDAEREPWSLSARRAGAVRAHLRGVGVRTELKAQAFGATQPVAEGTGEEARARNRRVEFVILERQERDGRARSAPGGNDRGGNGRGGNAAGPHRFELPAPVSVQRGASVMVSIASQRVAGEEALLYRRDPAVPGSALHPFRCARVRNESELALPPGPIAVFARGSYVGEGLLERLAARETAFIPFGLESASSVSVETRDREEPVRLLSLVDGVATVEDHDVVVTRYRIAPGARPPARIFVRHPRRAGYRVASLPPETETGAEAYLIPVPLRAARESVLEVKEQRPRQRTIEILDEASAGRVALYLDDASSLGKASRDRLRAVLAQQQRVAKLAREVAERREQLADVGAESGELRRSLTALARAGGDAALRGRLLARMKLVLERGEKLGAQLGTAGAALVEARGELRDAVKALRIVDR
jgi:outer membrane protein OmpA-like peptidoglycan-associated protein